MTAIAGAQPYWDTELFTDRVDVVRRVKATSPSGQNLPTPTTILSAVPCKIVHGTGRVDVSEVANLNLDQVQVIFPADAQIRKDDTLTPVAPSVGSPLRVGSYRHDTTLGYYWALCSQAS